MNRLREGEHLMTVEARNALDEQMKQLRKEAEQARAELMSEREERGKLQRALRLRENAMEILFDRLDKAGVSYDDLLS